MNELGYLGGGGKGLEKAPNAGRVGSNTEEGHSPRTTFCRVVTFGIMLMFYVKNIDKKEKP